MSCPAKGFDPGELRCARADLLILAVTSEIVSSERCTCLADGNDPCILVVFRSAGLLESMSCG